MEQETILTKSGLSRWNVLLVIAAIGMVSCSIYLLAHYFQTFFPKGLGGDLCNITGFFSCDAVAYSSIASIFSVPISLFGLLAGLFLLAATIFPSENLEGTNRFFVIVNGVGCLVLFIYSIVVIRHLCPVCTFYYIFSWLAVVAFIKGKAFKIIAPKIIVIYAAITLLSSLLVGMIVSGKKGEQAMMANVYAKQFLSYPDLGKPANDSDYRNYSSTKKFSDAPIQITIFSDFECPACGRLAQLLRRIEARYAGKANIQFFFYPLDQECNPGMMRSMHSMACKASYLAACAPEHFAKLHDLIFENQANLESEWLDELAKEYGVTECMNNPKTKEKVIAMVNEGALFNIRSTPTMLINGVKIEGVIPLVQLYAILDTLANK